MNKAIFLDRDGVINFERGYIHKLEDFIILPDVMEVLLLLQKRGYLLIIISNQGGIAKGLYEQNDTETLHSYLKDEMKKQEITLTEIYYCVHYPEVSKCICRKPDSVMLEKSMARFNIDAKQSYFIGDKERDMGAAEKAGVKGIQIIENTSLKEILNLIN